MSGSKPEPKDKTKQERLDEELDETFPASDPPSMTDPTHGVGETEPEKP